MPGGLSTGGVESFTGLLQPDINIITPRAAAVNIFFAIKEQVLDNLVTTICKNVTYFNKGN